MRLEDLRFPRRFEGMDVDTLKVQVVFVGITGALNTVVYKNLESLENSMHFKLSDLVGPMLVGLAMSAKAFGVKTQPLPCPYIRESTVDLIGCIYLLYIICLKKIPFF